jgi:hypothetical protein
MAVIFPRAPASLISFAFDSWGACQAPRLGPLTEKMATPITSRKQHLQRLLLDPAVWWCVDGGCACFLKCASIAGLSGLLSGRHPTTQDGTPSGQR